MMTARIIVWDRPGIRMEAVGGLGVYRSLARHSHEEYQIALGHVPQAELRCLGAGHTAPPGALTIVQAGEPHSITASDAEEGSLATVLYLHPDHLGRTIARSGGRSGTTFFPSSVSTDAGSIALFQRLESSLKSPASALERDGLLADFLGLLAQKHSSEPPPDRRTPPEASAVRRVLRFLDRNPESDVSLNELAALVGLNPTYLNSVFSKRVGLPPHAYQTQVRVARAKALLLAGHPPGLAAVEVGFYDQAHLSRHFKRLVGVTPGRYRPA